MNRPEQHFRARLAVLMVGGALIAALFPMAGSVLAATSITAVTGGSGISADTAPSPGTGAWTALGGPVVNEGAAADIPATGTVTLTLSGSFEFRTAALGGPQPRHSQPRPAPAASRRPRLSSTATTIATTLGGSATSGAERCRLTVLGHPGPPDHRRHAERRRSDLQRGDHRRGRHPDHGRRRPDPRVHDTAKLDGHRRDPVRPAAHRHVRRPLRQPARGRQHHSRGQERDRDLRRRSHLHTQPGRHEWERCRGLRGLRDRQVRHWLQAPRHRDGGDRGRFDRDHHGVPGCCGPDRVRHPAGARHPGHRVRRPAGSRNPGLRGEHGPHGPRHDRDAVAYHRHRHLDLHGYAQQGHELGPRDLRGVSPGRGRRRVQDHRSRPRLLERRERQLRRCRPARLHHPARRGGRRGRLHHAARRDGPCRRVGDRRRTTTAPL